MKVTPWLMLLLLFSSALFSCGNKAEEKAKSPTWVLESKKFFTYSYTPTGKIDTTYILHMNYENSQKKDSIMYFMTNTYKNDRIVEKKTYKKDDQGSPEYLNRITYEYDSKGRVIKSSAYQKNILYKEEKYVFDTSGKLVAFDAIVPKNYTKFDDEDFINLQEYQNAYDTVHLKYHYDNGNRVDRFESTDNAGKLIRTGINLYSGGNPIAAFSIDAKGDTTQRTSYQPEGQYMKVITSNDTLVITQILANGRTPLAQVTDNKKSKQMFRRVYNYGDKGLAETSFYILKML